MCAFDAVRKSVLGDHDDEETPRVGRYSGRRSGPSCGQYGFHPLARRVVTSAGWCIRLEDRSRAGSACRTVPGGWSGGQFRRGALWAAGHLADHLTRAQAAYLRGRQSRPTRCVNDRMALENELINMAC